MVNEKNKNFDIFFNNIFSNSNWCLCCFLFPLLFFPYTGASNVEHVILRELGHALGIHGHSNSSDDIMFPITNQNNDAILTLSETDVSLLNQIYMESFDYED